MLVRGIHRDPAIKYAVEVWYYVVRADYLLNMR